MSVGFLSVSPTDFVSIAFHPPNVNTNFQIFSIFSTFSPATLSGTAPVPDLVLVVKYRRQVFDDAISGRAKEIFAYIAPNYNITLEEWNHDKDHVHILFKAHPNTEISKFINAYKSASSRLLKKEFPQIKQKLWKEHFWSQSFCLLTTGGAPMEVIKKYIESQGQTDRKRK